MRRIYLDYNATTPILPEVREAMQPFLAEHFGNPSSDHSLGRACGEAISDAREQLAALIGADADEIIFTGGGTEANNAAIKGVFFDKKNFLSGHMVISEIEHPATTVPARWLAEHGVRLTVVPCDREGLVDPDDVRKAIEPDTRLVSIMLANNEVGTIQPIADIATICREKNVLSHTDAAQAVGKIPVDVHELGVDMLSIAAHKLYAPKGIGALFVRESVDLESLLHGASHERGMRAGTENTPYIVGLGKAARLAANRLADAPWSSDRRNQLHDQLKTHLDDNVTTNVQLESCLPNTLSVSFRNITGTALLESAPEVCASTGAACHSGVSRVSATLAAMQIDREQALGTVRLSTGVFTSEEDVTHAAHFLSNAWSRLQDS